MRRQFLLFLCALQFLTRIPGVHLQQFEAEWISRCAIYFPAVGQLVGAFSAVVLLGAAAIWHGWLPAVLAVAAGILLTGGLHEDGLADVADGFAGGHDRASRLVIMKDSRLGTFGALALLLCILLKIGALATVAPWRGAVTLLAAHGAARAAAVIVMGLLPYAGDITQAKVNITEHPVRTIEMVGALLIGAWPLFFLPWPGAVAGIALGSLLAALLALTARSLIGGQTGDVLGAVEQLFEVGFLLGTCTDLGVG